MMHFSDVQLDGVVNGIGAFITSRNEFIKRDGSRSSLFANFKSLEGRLKREGVEYHDIKFCFLIHDKVAGKVSIPLSDCIRIEGGWKAAREEEICDVKFLHIYNIYEQESMIVESIGYITTIDSGTHDINKESKYEYVKLRNLRKMTSTALNDLASFQCYALNVKRSPLGIDIELEGTTAVFHMWQIGKLMDYNTAIKKRRELDKNNPERCLPFTNGMDKYGTLYLFSTVDRSEAHSPFIKERIDNFIAIYISYLKELYPDKNIEYSSCEFNGEVIISEEVINIDHSNKDRS